jgi:8-oxo-dGTP diphosphatase
VTLYIVRHAKAGSRSNFDGDDIDRPLSSNGWHQAKLLGAKLATRSPTALIASPFIRCIQTLEPLAELCDLDVRTDDRLAEDQPFEPVLELLAEVADGTVLCSHGDIIPATMAALQRRGCRFLNEPDWRKATVWRLERTATGEFESAKVTSPPS